MADVNSTFKVYITNEPVFKVYVNNGAKGDSGTNGTDGVDGEGVASGGFTGQFLIKLSEEDFDTGWSNIDSTQVSYGDGTVSEGLDNRYTKGETDLLLDDKSDVGHNHDDRYFTETEVGVLLSGKSDTTHNHDLTYAPIVHNHDDIYYTDDEVDTLLLSKSDTTHTHDLIKNATEANAKIEASSTGGKFTRDVADSNHAFVVDLVNAGSTGNIQQWRWQSATKAFMDRNGQLGTPRVNNPTLADYSKMEFLDTGAVITRNVNDANPALKVNQANASSTGKILDLQFGGTSKASVDKNGTFYLNAIYLVDAIYANAGSPYGKLTVSNAGVKISRGRGDDTNPVLIVENTEATSTGDIAQFKFNGTTKLAIDKNGLIPQEAWITPTLLNLWVAFSGSLANAQYFKDQMGFVHLRGIVKSGTNGYIFSLPPGYRPAKSVYVATVSNGVFAYLVIDSTGGVNATAYSNLWVSLENVIFRAEL